MILLGGKPASTIPREALKGALHARLADLHAQFDAAHNAYFAELEKDPHNKAHVDALLRAHEQRVFRMHAERRELGAYMHRHGLHSEVSPP